MTLAEEAVKATLEYMDLEDNKWLQDRGSSSTWLLKPDESLRWPIELSNTEEPILEYNSDEAYSLITTERIISVLDEVYHEAHFKNLSIVRPFLTDKIIEEELPRDTLRVVFQDKKEFLAKFDPMYPTYFAKMLATNLIWKIQKGVMYRYRFNQ